MCTCAYRVDVFDFALDLLVLGFQDPDTDLPQLSLIFPLACNLVNAVLALLLLVSQVVLFVLDLANEGFKI